MHLFIHVILEWLTAFRPGLYLPSSAVGLSFFLSLDVFVAAIVLQNLGPRYPILIMHCNKALKSYNPVQLIQFQQVEPIHVTIEAENYFAEH